MSGQPFDAMWTAPPPPSYIDTVYMNPKDYVVLATSSGEEAFVHRDCLMESPVLRLAFRKRVPLFTENVLVAFFKEDEPSCTGASSPSINAVDGALASGQPIAAAVDPAAGDGGGGSKENEGDGVPQGAGAAPVETGIENAMAPDPQYPATLKETLRTDNSVRVLFPRLKGDQLNVLVSYLYFKHRYNRRVSEERPAFEVPTTAALEVMRVAAALEC
ncbi:hypothetical protein conserved [Leishmania donovani]|uniref:Uncharacterized protein n=3 Tax=Leishmania donovani species complex TaxID=38574 RepID=A4I3B2_LEIIN|nr:conserved hypothetical protein [Leishmania infantum JPCM5]AYU80181.1 hypothetical protein LdCL_280007700 [Leishmania donovani]CAC9501829.1 hypothetical_protein_-_conserved [Leishmania infantum]TPP40603.1 hypothetical protein CGC20_13940 [Leishmania donovani]CAJ1990169.1 hypothetical protein conserved [Leishmania donovani]CAM69266.1 conserved hypothetical protein [Leishmania infantum JPCM5]|eukprot:XP_001470074.1 conserved hypothetical protein [Leishmania infantum JPCM5]